MSHSNQIHAVIMMLEHGMAWLLLFVFVSGVF
jgi:hypothetical protein